MAKKIQKKIAAKPKQKKLPFKKMKVKKETKQEKLSNDWGVLAVEGLRTSPIAVPEDYAMSVPAGADMIRNYARANDIDMLLNMIVSVLKEPEFNSIRYQAGCIAWAERKIKENKLAARLLAAYRKNPMVLSEAVIDAEDGDDLEDTNFGGDLN